MSRKVREYRDVSSDTEIYEYEIKSIDDLEALKYVEELLENYRDEEEDGVHSKEDIYALLLCIAITEYDYDEEPGVIDHLLNQLERTDYSFGALTSICGNGVSPLSEALVEGGSILEEILRRLRTYVSEDTFEPFEYNANDYALLKLSKEKGNEIHSFLFGTLYLDISS